MDRMNKSFFAFLVLVLVLTGLQTVLPNPIPGKKVSLTTSGEEGPQFNLWEANANAARFQIKISALYLSSIELDDVEYQTVRIPGYGLNVQKGAPAVPVLRKYIKVPPEARVNVDISVNSYKELEQINLPPVIPPQPETEEAERESITKNEEIFSADKFYPEQNITIGEVQIIRKQGLVLVSIYPLQYNPVKQTAKILTDFTVEIQIDGSSKTTIPSKYSSRLFDTMVNRFVLNPVLKTEALQKDSDNWLDKKAETGCDYLIITHEDFLEAADSLAAWRRLTGLRTKIVTPEETGYDSESIRNYIQNAYDDWDIVPLYIVLLGDAEYIPTNYRTEHPSDGQGYIGTDLYYATVDGNDLFPDINIGRIPVDTPLEANGFVRKVIQYERYPVEEQSFYTNAEIIAYFQDDDNPDTDYNERDGYSDRRFVLTSEEIRDFLLSKGYNPERIYYAKSEVTPTNYNNGNYANGEPLPNELLRSNGFAWDGDAQDISNGIKEGRFLVSHRDHGSRNGWGSPSYKSSNVAVLDNGNKLPVVFSVNCQTGWFDNETDDDAGDTGYDEESFVEHWLRNFLGGAIGVFGSTRISYSGYNDDLTKGIIDAIWPQFLNYGSADNIYQLGSALNVGKLYMYSNWSGGSRIIVEMEEFHYFGDPATQIRTQYPQMFAIDSVGAVVFNQTELNLYVGEADAAVSLVQSGRLLATGYSNSTGDVTLEFDPLYSPDPVILCVYKANFRPYVEKISVVREKGTHLVCESAGIIEQNNDERVNSGETITWNFKIKNNGTEDASQITLKLSCADSQITLLDTVATISRLNTGESTIVSELGFKTAKDCPPDYPVKMTLLISTASGYEQTVPIEFLVEQGEAQLEFSPSLIGEQADTLNEIVPTEIRISNDGYGILDYTIRDASKEFISLVDTSYKTWHNISEGVGNIYYVEKTTNLLRFSEFIQVNAPTTFYFFVYRGEDYNGTYYKIAQSEISIDKTGEQIVWSDYLNVNLDQNKYYYLGVSWDGDAAVCRMAEKPDDDIAFGTVRSGVVNLGGVPPQESINQSINYFLPYVQQIETGQGEWLAGLPISGSLFPGENTTVAFNLRSIQTDTSFYTDLLLTTNDHARDSIYIPVYFQTGQNTLGLVFQAGSIEDADDNNAVNRGENVKISLSVKNMGMETATNVAAGFSSVDTFIAVTDSAENLGTINPGEETESAAFEFTVSSQCPLGHEIAYEVLLHSDEGFTDTLHYVLPVKEGLPTIAMSTDTVFVTSDFLDDSIHVELDVSNEGYGDLVIEVENPVNSENQVGTMKEDTWWPKGSGFGNIYYQVNTRHLLAVRHYLQVQDSATFYVFVYEGQNLKGEYNLIAVSEMVVNEPGSGWYQSGELDCSLKAGKYYYIGISWQGEASVARAEETVPFQTTDGIVYSSAYNLGGAPPEQTIDQPYKVSYPTVQQLITGEGLWLQCGSEPVRLIPHQQGTIPVQFISTKPETTLTASLKIHTNDSRNEIVEVPLRFKITAENTGIDDNKPHLPQQAVLYPNYPNPFNNSTQIEYAIVQSGMVDIGIYNILGQRVKTLVHKKQQAGRYSIIWQGENQNGKTVASGLYFLTMTTQGRQINRKIVLLK